MTQKRNSSIVPRLTGMKGRRDLIAAVSHQQSVAGDITLSRELVEKGEIVEFSPGKTIVRQGDSNNDIYFIVDGSVSILVNKREVATRERGTHVGEMTLLEPTARRGASIVAKEKTVLLKVPEKKIIGIAEEYPDLWRQFAIELSSRLRGYSKFIREPNSTPVVFIGSSSEALGEAAYLHRSLQQREAVAHLWTKGVFQLSQTTIEDLVSIAKESDFAVLFLTPDDITTSRGRRKASPRDNVVFELGLFVGAIGRQRTYVAVPEGKELKLPSDLLGVTHATYKMAKTGSFGKRLSAVTRLICERIKELGPK